MSRPGRRPRAVGAVLPADVDRRLRRRPRADAATRSISPRSRATSRRAATRWRTWPTSSSGPGGGTLADEHMAHCLELEHAVADRRVLAHDARVQALARACRGDLASAPSVGRGRDRAPGSSVANGIIEQRGLGLRGFCALARGDAAAAAPTSTATSSCSRSRTPASPGCACWPATTSRRSSAPAGWTTRCRARPHGRARRSGWAAPRCSPRPRAPRRSCSPSRATASGALLAAERSIDAVRRARATLRPGAGAADQGAGAPPAQAEVAGPP